MGYGQMMGQRPKTLQDFLVSKQDEQRNQTASGMGNGFSSNGQPHVKRNSFVEQNVDMRESPAFNSDPSQPMQRRGQSFDNNTPGGGFGPRKRGLIGSPMAGQRPKMDFAGTDRPYDLSGAGMPQPMQKEKKPGFFKRDSTKEAFATFADTFMQLQHGVNPGLSARIERGKNRDFRQNQFEQQLEAKNQTAKQINDWKIQAEQIKQNAPQYFMSNGDRVQYNPTTGESKTLFDGQEAFEDYAETLGIQPGTPEYDTAVQDYVLRGSGPTAYDYDVKLDDERTRNDIRRKQSPSFRQNNPAPRRPRTSPKRRSSSRSTTPVATDKNGNKMILRNGAWVAVN